jgi:WhiB family transcriptional regulator, redox-sensing transcriptional regulator
VSARQNNLMLALAGAVSLPGARCRNRSHLFDAAETDENPERVKARHLQAIGLCKICPSFQKCADWLDSLPPSRKPSGVVAGRVINIPKPRKKPNNTKEEESA